MKIYFGDKTFYLNDLSAFSANNQADKSIEINSFESFNKELKNCLSDKDHTRFFLKSVNTSELENWFKSKFIIVEAAGGLVVNSKDELLFIFRNGKWDLPKGKIEKDESVEIAAIREVEEECGISDLSITKKIGTTYHIYSLNNKMILKPTYWFLMHSNYSKMLHPQLEEGITQVKWIEKSNVEEILENSYDSIRDVIKNNF